MSLAKCPQDSNDILKSGSELVWQIRTNPPHHMNVVEGAIYLGISERKLRELIALKEVKAVRFGSRIVLPRKLLDQFIEANTG